MTAFTDDDVEIVARAFTFDLDDWTLWKDEAREVLAAVAPAIAARARRDEVQRIERAMALYEAPARVAEILDVATKLQGTPAGYSQEDQDNLGQCEECAELERRLGEAHGLNATLAARLTAHGLPVDRDDIGGVPV